MSEVFPEPSPFTKGLFEKLKNHPKRIVFPEGEDLRVVRVAAKMVELEIGIPILLGDPDRIERIAEKDGLPLTFIKRIRPEASSDFSLFCRYYEKMEAARGNRVANVEDVMAKPHNFAAMMVQYGNADGMVAGNEVYPSTVFRSVMHFIKPLTDADHVFSAALLVGPHLEHFGQDGLMFLADCGVISDPTIDELAFIAIETGKLARHVLGRAPRVALLSHSTKGTYNTPSAQKMRAATEVAQEMVQKQYLEMEIDGELQADVALDATCAEVKLQTQTKLKAPDVLVFPNLDSGNIAMKLLEHVGGAQKYGQFVMGLARPTAQLPRAATEETILGTAAMVAVEAVKYNQLYLDGLV